MDNGSQRNIAMNQALEIARLLKPNMAGELLRHMSFAEEVGCYTSFDLIPGFIEHDPFALDLAARTALLGCYANNNEEVRGITAYQHDRTKMIVAWYWDGDGTLIFQGEDFLLSNSDCKKDYRWERQEPNDWISTYTGYDCPELVKP